MTTTIVALKIFGTAFASWLGWLFAMSIIEPRGSKAEQAAKMVFIALFVVMMLSVLNLLWSF